MMFVAGVAWDTPKRLGPASGPHPGGFWSARARRGAFNSFALVVSALLTGSAYSDSGSLAAFRKEYAVGAAALEGFYGKLRIRAVHTYDSVRRRTELDLLSAGTRSRLVSRVVEAADGDEIGYSVVSVVSDELPFLLSRPSNGEQYTVGDARDLASRVEYNRTGAAPLFAPYCFYEVRILDLLVDDNFKIIGVSTVENGDDRLKQVRVDWEQRTSEPYRSTGWFLFAPNLTWALLEFENRRQGSSDATASCLRATLRYEGQIGPYPLVKAIEYWAEAKCGSGERKNVERFDIEEISQAEAKPDDFSPQAFGVRGLEPHRAASRVWMMLALGIALIALAITIRVTRRKAPQQ